MCGVWKRRPEEGSTFVSPCRAPSPAVSQISILVSVIIATEISLVIFRECKKKIISLGEKKNEVR